MLSLSEKYRFSDFTIENYKRILLIARDNYDFVFFPELEKYTGKAIILRHDVEFSVPIAVKMAEIEADNGIKATYFIQVHGDFYNILEKNTFKAIKKIQSLGHQIGLHFDAHFWEISSVRDLEKSLAIDKNIFSLFFDIEPCVFSFHNTNSLILSFEANDYAGLLNVYSKQFKSEIGYCSDSTGHWRYERLEDRIKEAKDQLLQVLIHDGMWSEEILPPRRRIYSIIDNNAIFLKNQYDHTLKIFGAKNIDWDVIL